MAGIFLNGRLYGTDEPNPSSIQIKPWSPGTSYQAGTIVLHAYNFYQCMEDNSDTLFNLEKWRHIGIAEWVSRAFIPFWASNNILVKIACLLPLVISDSKNFLKGKL